MSYISQHELLPRLALLLAILVCAADLSAQDQNRIRVDIHNLPKDESQRHGYFKFNVGTDDAHTYFATYRSPSTIRGSDTDLAVYAVPDRPEDARRANLKIPINAEWVRYEDIKLIDDRIYVIYSTIDKQEKASFLFVQTVEPNSLSPIGEPRLLATLDGATKMQVDYWVVVSPRTEEENYVIAYKREKRKKRTDVGFLVLNRALEHVHEHTLTDLDREMLERIGIVGANGDGTLYFTVTEGGDSRRAASHPGKHYLCQVTPEGKGSRQPIDLDGNHVPTLTTTGLYPNGNVLISGTFYDSGQEDYGGLFVHTYHGKSLRQLHSESFALRKEDDRYVRAPSGEPLDDAVRTAVKNLRTSGLHFTPEGGVYLVQESFVIYQDRSSSAILIKSRYDGVSVISLAKDGQMVYTQYVPTRSATTSRPGAVVVGDRLLLNITDSPDVTDPNYVAVPYMKRVSRLRHILFDLNGEVWEVENPELVPNNDNYVHILPSSAMIAPSGSNVYFYGNQSLSSRQILQLIFTD